MIGYYFSCDGEMRIFNGQTKEMAEEIPLPSALDISFDLCIDIE